MSDGYQDGSLPSSRGSPSIRSRLPSVTSTAHRNPHNPLLSPLRRQQPSDDDQGDKYYRDRSNERLGDKIQRAEIFKMHVDSPPLKNTSKSSKIHDREYEVEQDERGRSRKEKSVDIHKAPTHSPAKQRRIAEDPATVGGVENDEMFSLMGFSGFGTTKGRPVAGAQGGAVRRVVSTDYRQYMNREKGFNRALSPGRK